MAIRLAHPTQWLRGITPHPSVPPRQGHGVLHCVDGDLWCRRRRLPRFAKTTRYDSASDVLAPFWRLQLTWAN